MTINLVLEHLFIVLSASILAVLIGLPLGILAYTFPKIRPVILRIVDLLQTIPALALLGIIMVFMGAGKPTVIVGITLYSLLPIVRNTCLGFQEVDPGIKEAARGMGMSSLYRLLWVEFPMALPTIFTGIRIAVVGAIATAVFAAFVGGGGLGGVINRGIRIQNMSMILSGTAALMVIAVLLDFFMSRFENRIRKSGASGKKLWVLLVIVPVAFFLLLPFGIDTVGKNELRMYDGTYSEPQLITRMAKMLIEDKTDLKVTIQDQMTAVNNFKAMTADKPTCDLMIAYDGTLLTTFLHQDPSDVPEGMTTYEYANQEARKTYGVHLLDKLGFDNTYAVAVTQSVAEKYNLETISDLVPVAPQLVFGAEHEFFTQEGSMKFGPFTKFYGLKFKDVSQVETSLKYAAVENGSFEVTEVYTTDGLNRKANLKVLEDDRNFFPEYNGAFLVPDDLFERYGDIAPNLEEVLNSLVGHISNEDMVEMTYEVDVMGRDLDTVARAYLVDCGLLSQ